ncbi:hypothetical protein IF1G_10202 [Cordyceps javanica]|uniref:Uncharacterized protein n=1 Tax=Cordyceps javanica TaxID=43265 RepID=A0A545UNC5_9HYPO|nr:hypothetical protein IF1G_10202 [Cordyceps javanica]
MRPMTSHGLRVIGSTLAVRKRENTTQPPPPSLAWRKQRFFPCDRLTLILVLSREQIRCAGAKSKKLLIRCNDIGRKA